MRSARPRDRRPICGEPQMRACKDALGSITSAGRRSASSPVSAPARSATASKPGPMPGAGTYLLPRLRRPALAAGDRLPARLPELRRLPFRRDSIFEPMQDHGATTAKFAVRRAPTPPDWLDEAREDAARPRPLPRLPRATTARSRSSRSSAGWTRIGRSAAADLRLDDPSVSRRHALIVSDSRTSAARARRPQPQRRLRQRRGGRVGRSCATATSWRSAATGCSRSKPERGISGHRRP